MKMEKPLSHWIRLLFRFVGKTLIVITMLIYIGFGENAAVQLYQRTLDRVDDITAINKYIDIIESSSYKMNDNGEGVKNLSALTMWLKSRPLAETDKLVEMISPKSAKLGPGIFFEISRRQMKLGRIKEALFWMELGRYRLRYDIIRCNAGEEGTQDLEKMMELMHTQTPVDTLLEQHPEMLKTAVQRVLDFDGKYPADDDPNPICKAISPKPPVNEADWSFFRSSLRRQTEKFTKNTDKEKQP